MSVRKPVGTPVKTRSNGTTCCCKRPTTAAKWSALEALLCDATTRYAESRSSSSEALSIEGSVFLIKIRQLSKLPMSSIFIESVLSKSRRQCPFQRMDTANAGSRDPTVQSRQCLWRWFRFAFLLSLFDQPMLLPPTPSGNLRGDPFFFHG